MSLHDCSPPAMSIVRGVWRIIGGPRASTLRYAFRTDESIRVSVLMWLNYPWHVVNLRVEIVALHVHSRRCMPP